MVMLQMAKDSEFTPASIHELTNAGIRKEYVRVATVGGTNISRNGHPYLAV